MKESKAIGNVYVKKGEVVFPCKNVGDTNRRGIRVRFGKHFKNICNVQEDDLVECTETKETTAERISTEYRRILKERNLTVNRQVVSYTVYILYLSVECSYVLGRWQTQRSNIAEICPGLGFACLHFLIERC